MKLRKKLFLSCAALAACAATLVSTTYAWYTSNTEVTATGIAGESQANGDSLLLISKDGTDGSFSNTVELDINSTTLIPIAYTNNTAAAPTIKTISPGTGEVSSDAATSAYIKFDLYFRGVDGDAGVPVYLKQLVLVNNDKAALPSKDVLSTSGLGSSWNISTNSTYTVDILRTIKIGTTSTAITKSGDAAAVETAGTSQLLDPEALVSLGEDSLANLANFSAHDYYEAVTGKDLGDTPADGSTKLAASSQINFGTTPATLATGNSLKVTFYVFIDGWDLACFDAVQGQDFTLTLGFSSEAPSAIVTTISQ